MSDLKSRLEQSFKEEFPGEYDFSQHRPLSRIETAAAAYLGTIEAHKDLGLTKA